LKKGFSPPGRLYDLGGFRVHLDVRGTGAPAVILDSAFAGTSLSWFAIQSRIASFAQVVSYDRAGFGWSDRSPSPRRVDHFVSELRRALRAAGIAPPYVLVGHSYGGWIARVYAASHLEDVAGMVLVDVPHPREWTKPSEDQRRRIQRGARLARRGAAVARFGLVRLMFLPGVRKLVLGVRAPGERGRIENLLEKVPASLRPVLQSFWMRPETLLSLASLIENAPESATLVDRATLSLRDRPLLVLTATRPTPDRLRDQDEVARLSSRGRQVVAERSGHWIPLEEPELVVEAVREVVSSVREAHRPSSGS
jgi:pimeloyl-ACP methyl ester carboxylesterase